MRETYLPPGGKNAFQEIKKKRKEAEAKGIKIINLSIGQPAGSAIYDAMRMCSEAVLHKERIMHEYQDNDCPACPPFAQRFVQAHVRVDLGKCKDVSFLPTPGTKPMLPLIMLACGAGDRSKDAISVSGMTKPGYGVPATWAGYLGVNYSALRTDIRNQFLFTTRDIQRRTDLVMMNYPHNPTGQISSREYLRKICRYCERHNIRLFNDAAYAILADDEHYTLTDVAVEFKNLSWAEAFSASKAGNFTGWRIGTIAGSPDFVTDIATIKGNTDSGFFAPAAIGILHAFEYAEGRKEIDKVSAIYKLRRDLLIKTLVNYGMVPAVDPKAGFFCTFKCPQKAFGIRIHDSEQFNNLMIERTGVLGVPFDPYVRFAVVEDVEAMLPDIENAFALANVVS